jgi:hypothetical protein
MGKKTPEQHKLNAALFLVKQHAQLRYGQAQDEIAAKPDSIHIGYWQDEKESADTVQRWCFIQQMRIDPD